MSLELEALTSSIPRGRRWVAAQAAAGGASGEQLAVITLLGTELITNAVVHGPSPGTVTVRVAARDGCLRVEVDDESTDLPRRSEPDADGVGGRGVMLVAVLSTRWGSERRDPDGKTVWFELRV